MKAIFKWRVSYFIITQELYEVPWTMLAEDDTSSNVARTQHPCDKDSGFSLITNTTHCGMWQKAFVLWIKKSVWKTGRNDTFSLFRTECAVGVCNAQASVGTYRSNCTHGHWRRKHDQELSSQTTIQNLFPKTASYSRMKWNGISGVSSQLNGISGVSSQLTVNLVSVPRYWKWSH